MRSRLLLLLLTPLLPTLANEARADVLFVDMNFSYKEVIAARNAARDRSCGVDPSTPCEEIKVVPEMSDGDRAQAYAIRQQIEAAKTNQNRAAENRATEALRALLREKGFLGPKEGEIDFDAGIKKALNDVEATHHNLSSLVISGHHGGKAFAGALGKLEEKDLGEIFYDHKRLAESIQSAYLWGCYTATPVQVKFWLELKRKVFPGLLFLAGFNASAPTQERAGDMDYLTHIMLNEKRTATSEGTRGLLDEVVAKVPMSAAIASFQANTYVKSELDGTVSSQTIDEALRCDTVARDHWLTDAEYSQETWMRFVEAQRPGYEDIPKDTGHSNPLRRSYDRARDIEICFENEEVDTRPPPATKAEADTRARADDERHYNDRLAVYRINEQLLGLLYFGRLRQRFEDVGKPELTEARQILANIRHPELLPKDIGSPALTRKQLVGSTIALQEFLKTPEFRAIPQADQSKLRMIHYLVLELVNVQIQRHALDMIETTSADKLRSGFHFGDELPSELQAPKEQPQEVNQELDSRGQPRVNPAK